MLVGGGVLHPSVRALAGVSVHVCVSLWVRGKFCVLLSRAELCGPRHSLDTLQSCTEDPPILPFYVHTPVPSIHSLPDPS